MKVAILIFILGLVIRFFVLYPANITIGFDQARDLFDSLTIWQDGNLRIIGPTAGNNPNLHHGVLFLYYMLPPLVIFGGNPFWVAMWNSLFNTATVIILFFFARSLFRSNLAGIITSLLVAVSYQFVQFSGWLSNPSPTLFTVPLFYFGLWQYYVGKKWGLPLATAALGSSIQFELFFIYLIPIAVITWLLLKPKLPGFKLAFGALSTFTLTTSTMIATEIKFNFGGIKAILFPLTQGGGHASLVTSVSSFFEKFWQVFAYNLWPQQLALGKLIGVVVVGFLILQIIRSRKNKNLSKALLFLLLYLFSSTIMLLQGYHAAPWFLIGVPPAVILASGYALSQIKPQVLILPIIIFIALNNIATNWETRGKGQVLLEPDPSSLANSQIAVIDYSYQESGKKPFAINTVTNPLYVNSVWAYQYVWYGKEKYGYLPGWLGGDQLHPYDTLPKPTNDEQFLYLIIDQTPRIPHVHKLLAVQWADEHSRLVEEKNFGGILVQKRVVTKL